MIRFSVLFFDHAIITSRVSTNVITTAGASSPVSPIRPPVVVALCSIVLINCAWKVFLIMDRHCFGNVWRVKIHQPIIMLLQTVSQEDCYNSLCSKKWEVSRASIARKDTGTKPVSLNKASPVTTGKVEEPPSITCREKLSHIHVATEPWRMRVDNPRHCFENYQFWAGCYSHFEGWVTRVRCVPWLQIW